MVYFLMGLSLGIAGMVALHIYHNKIKTAIQTELAKAKTDLTTALAKVPV